MDWAIGDIYVQNTDKGLNKGRSKFFRYSSFLTKYLIFFLAFNAKLGWLGMLLAYFFVPLLITRGVKLIHKTSHLQKKKFTCKGLCGRCLSVCPIPPHCIRTILYTNRGVCSLLTRKESISNYYLIRYQKENRKNWRKKML
jgi:hypothetical protein